VKDDINQKDVSTQPELLYTPNENIRRNIEDKNQGSVNANWFPSVNQCSPVGLLTQGPSKDPVLP
jgi:hypothetical protein